MTEDHDQRENDVLELICKQIGSDGKQGWPVCVRDRISFPENTEKLTTANFAITFLWTMRDDIMPKLDKTNLALASNFYTASGLEGMIRNILGNPYIRYVILLGNEYSSMTEDKQFDLKNINMELTSANAIRAFFEKGIDENRKIPGFESSVYFDRNIPTEMIQKVRDNVQLIDLNKQMSGKSLNEKITETNRLMDTLTKKGSFMETPKIFDYEKTEKAFPYEGGALTVKNSTIPKTWIEIINTIYRYGKDNLMDANTDRWIKEINNIVAVIHDPQNLDLSINPFLVPMTIEKIKAYQKEILSSELPKGKAYTYGNKLRAYQYSNSKEIKNIVNTKEYKDFEFGQGLHLDKNIRYLDDGCEIDQMKEIIDVLKRNIYSKSAVAMTWHVHEELMRKHKSSPCLVLIQTIVQDEKLNLTVYFRSHDMVQGWPENAYGCAAIQKEIADAVGIKPGILTIISGSAQIYRHYYNQVETMLKKFRKREEDFYDPRGDFTVEIKDDFIVATLIDPKTKKELEKFKGKTAKEVYTKISLSHNFNTEHALYIGSELGKAETALLNNLKFEQDEELKLN